MHSVRVDHFFFIDRDDTFSQIKIIARESMFKKNDGSITLECIPVSMKIVFLWVSLNRTPIHGYKCCSLGTSLGTSNNTITLYIRDFSLNIRRITVIGTYSSKLYT